MTDLPGDKRDKDDDELSIPRAGVAKIIKNVISEQRISNDFRELLTACGNEFLRVLAQKANSVCEAQDKRTITADHVFVALNELGFSNYSEIAHDAASQSRDEQEKKRVKHHLRNPTISEDKMKELAEIQRRLFEEAKVAANEERKRAEWEEVKSKLALSMVEGTESDVDDF